VQEPDFGKNFGARDRQNYVEATERTAQVTAVEAPDPFEGTMYSLINHYAPVIVRSIPATHVSDYEWLVQNVGQVDSQDYQSRYRKFWAMNAAQLSPAFYSVYFGALAKAAVEVPSLEGLSKTLHGASARQNGKQSLQFSFATKLLHMVDRCAPIYDSKVAKFYFFQPLPAEGELAARINRFVAFHTFLVGEYARVLNCGLLRGAIQAFRQQFNPTQLTDEKCIDSLLWAFVTLLERGALPASQIVYC
jgi:hypothetical protein